MAYVWAAYRKGALATMGDDFADGSMSAGDFREAFEAEIFEHYDGCWTLFAHTASRGLAPVGLILGFWSHRDPMKAPFMIIGDMVWFPWSSARNRVESAVNFFHRMRNEIPMVEYARTKDRGFFEVMMRHAVMRHIGTSWNVYQGEPAHIYETRRDS